MRIVYSRTANQLKERILKEYIGIGAYFDRLEDCIIRSPYEAAEEKIAIEGQVVIAHKRNVRTGLFSGNIVVSFLYLSLSYVIVESKQQIVVIGVYVRYGMAP